MLSKGQRQIVFALFCVFAVACAGAELFVLVSLVANPSDALAKAFAAVVGAGLLGGIGVLFVRLVDKTFVSGTLAPVAILSDLASERSRLLDSNTNAALDFSARRDLMTATLEFAETCLRPWVAGTHFEFSVFVDEIHPLLFAYYDSGRSRVARTMRERESAPDFYVEKGYEVVKLLRDRSTFPRVIADTYVPEAGYVFATAQQKRQLRSTVLLSVDTGSPCALVVASNKENAFSENDAETMGFLKYIAALVRYDLFQEGFVQQLATLRPDLFPPPETTRLSQ